MSLRIVDHCLVVFFLNLYLFPVAVYADALSFLDPLEFVAVENSTEKSMDEASLEYALQLKERAENDENRVSVLKKKLSLLNAVSSKNNLRANAVRDEIESLTQKLVTRFAILEDYKRELLLAEQFVEEKKEELAPRLHGRFWLEKAKSNTQAYRLIDFLIERDTKALRQYLWVYEDLRQLHSAYLEEIKGIQRDLEDFELLQAQLSKGIESNLQSLKSVNSVKEAALEQAQDLMQAAQELERRFLQPALHPVFEQGQMYRFQMLPVEGPVIRNFGRSLDARSGMILMHPGIELRTNPHAPVRTVDTGLVIYSEQLPGLKGIVIIEHDSSTYSVYARIQERSVYVNQHVRSGEIVGFTNEQGRLFFGVVANSSSHTR